MENSARGAFEETVELEPEEADAWLHLGLLAERDKDPQHAMAYYQNTLRIRPNDAVAHYNSARLLLSIGHVVEAVAHYQAFLKIMPHAPEAPIARSVLALIYRDYPQLAKS